MAAEILLSWGPGETRLALVKDGVPVEFRLVRPNLLAGAVVLGRVVELASKLDAAFVDIGADRPAFLPGAKGLTQGQTVLARVRADARGTKGALLTADVSLPGRFLAYSPLRPGLNVSRKLEPEVRESLHAALAPLVAEGEGVVVRTAAAAASPAELAAELAALRSDWAAIDARRNGKAPALVWRPDPLAAFLAEHPEAERVWIDDGATFAEARARFGALVAQSKGPAFALHDADEAFERALAPSVALPCGGRVTFEPTAALVAIDVDSGPATAAEANTQAIDCIARQLRLRGLGGQMALDFVSGGGKGAVAKLANRLREAVADDPVPTHVFGVSPLGLVELTRERRGPSLADSMSEVAHRPTAEAAALAALRLAVAEAAHRPGRGLALRVSPDVAAAIRPQALAEAEARIGRPLAIRPDQGRSREDAVIEES